MRTCIKSRTSSNFGQIGPLTRELAALEFQKISHRLIMGKWCLHASLFIFYQIIIKVAGNQDSHNSLDEFDFGPLVSMAHLGESGGSVVECRTPERAVRGSRPTAAMLCPWARHFTPQKYWLITQEAMAPSRYDWKIVDWDVKPQHNQPTNHGPFMCFLKWDLTLVHWTQVSDRCPLGYLFSNLSFCGWLIS